MNEVNQTGFPQDVDSLLADVKQLLGEDVPAAEEQTATPEAEPVPSVSAEDVQIDYEKFYGETPADPVQETASDAPATAEDIQIDYEKFYGEIPPEPEEADVVFQPLTAYEQSKPSYQSAVRAQIAAQKEAERQAREMERLRREQAELAAAERMEKERQLRKKKRPPQKDDTYSQWLYEQGNDPETERRRQAVESGTVQETAAAPVKKKKKGGFGRFLLVVLLILALGAAFVHFLWAEQPTAEIGRGERKKDVSTVLVAGTDEGGYRTDTMMLVRFDRQEKTVSLVSVPRDTLVYCEYSVPKLNSAYGWSGGGEEGMEELMSRMEEIIGFRPDGYAVVGLDTFKQLVDLMGGVKFDVPVEMHYADPGQGLNIDLAAGEQMLDGEKAMQVVRFRSGYANADLGRVEVQRQFVSAAIDQWVSPKNLIHIPKALKLLTDGTQTDLSAGELVWLAESALFCRGETSMQTLPGTAAYISGGSYYVLDASGVAETVNEMLNPYQKEVTTDDLWIRVG